MLLESKVRLNKSSIATLDAARAIAALYVIAHHVAQANNWVTGFGFIFKFGSEAVIVFFILSGFLIYANEHTRSEDLYGYYFRRLRRIYPTLIGAMIISSIVAVDNGSFFNRFSWIELIGNICNLQDINYLKPGVIVSPFLQNEPLWSLSYEVLFYAIFPFVMKSYKSNQSLTDNFIGLSCCLSYICFFMWPDHFSLVLSYFIVWWTGAMVARSYLEGYRSFFKIGYSLVWLIILIFISGMVVIYDGFNGLYRYPFLQTRHFIFSFIITVAIFSPIGRSIKFVFTKYNISFSYIASISYGLYLLHYPLIIQSYRAKSVMGFLYMFIILIIFSHLFDREMNSRLPKFHLKIKPTTTV